MEEDDWMLAISYLTNVSHIVHFLCSVLCFHFQVPFSILNSPICCIFAVIIKRESLKSGKTQLPFLKTAAVLSFLMILLSGLLRSHRLSAQEAGTGKPVRIMFLVDASSSMVNEWNGGESRFQAAVRLIMAIVDSTYAINGDAEFAVRVFGHQHPAQEKNCYDSRLEVAFNKQNIDQIKTRLQYISPLGYSPIAWSLKETALEDFGQSNKYAYSIILVTDGGESCGGDICATMQKLLADKISFRPYILSMIDYEPLKQQYDCLGAFITVAKEADIAPAIQKIMDDNRPVITMFGLARPFVPMPKSPEPPPVVIPPARSVPVVTASPINTRDTVAPPVVEPQASQTPPLPDGARHRAAVETLQVRKVVIKPLKPLHSDAVPARFNILFSLANAKPVSVPHLPQFKNPLPPDPARPLKPVTAATNPDVANLPPAIVTTKDADRTTLQIYFTNGKGKYYSTEPDMIIADSKTGKQVKRQFRTVDFNGIPEAIEVPAGTYDITFPGSTNRASNAIITAEKENRVEIVVNNGSLAFAYTGNPERPVKEYIAYVSKRFEDRTVTEQNCDISLPYEPSNYHIEINTLPPTLLNADISFGAVTLIQLPEPGAVQIDNTDNIGRVEFWRQLGDQFVRFYEMNVLGDVAGQQVELKPGPYEVRYIRPTGGPVRKVSVIRFQIKSNETTMVHLEQ